MAVNMQARSRADTSLVTMLLRPSDWQRVIGSDALKASCQIQELTNRIQSVEFISFIAMNV